MQFFQCMKVMGFSVFFCRFRKDNRQQRQILKTTGGFPLTVIHIIEMINLFFPDYHGSQEIQGTQYFLIELK